MGKRGETIFRSGTEVREITGEVFFRGTRTWTPPHARRSGRRFPKCRRDVRRRSDLRVDHRQLLLLVFVQVVVEAVKLRELALMENADDPDAIGHRTVKDGVAHVPDAMETGSDVIAGASRGLTFRKTAAQLLQAAQILVGLRFAPALDGEDSDLEDVRAGTR